MRHRSLKSIPLAAIGFAFLGCSSGSQSGKLDFSTFEPNRAQAGDLADILRRDQGFGIYRTIGGSSGWDSFRPLDRWSLTEALHHFEHEEPWKTVRDKWTATDGLELPAEFGSRKEDRWKDVVLDCQVRTFLSQPSRYCDYFCNGLGLIARADGLRDVAFRLPSCGKDESCEPEMSTPGFLTGLRQLATASTYYYYAAHFLMPPIVESDPLGIEDSLAEACADAYYTSQDESPAILESTPKDLYSAELSYAVENFGDTAKAVTKRLLARADAGFSDLSPVEAAVLEWSGDAAPRTVAARFLLGSGVDLQPCTVDPKDPAVAGGLAVYELAGRDPNPETIAICDLASRAGVDLSACMCHPGSVGLPYCPPPFQSAEWKQLWDKILSAFGSNRTGFELATRYILESIRSSHTATLAIGEQYPIFQKNPELPLHGAKKPVRLWVLDGTLRREVYLRLSPWLPASTATNNEVALNDLSDALTIRAVSFDMPGLTHELWPGVHKMANGLRGYWDTIGCSSQPLLTATYPGPDMRCEPPGGWSRVTRQLDRLIGSPDFSTTWRVFGNLCHPGEETETALFFSAHNFSAIAEGLGIDINSDDPEIWETEFDQWGSRVAGPTLLSQLRLVPRGLAAKWLSNQVPSLNDGIYPQDCYYESKDALTCSFSTTEVLFHNEAISSGDLIPEFDRDYPPGWSVFDGDFREGNGEPIRYGGWVLFLGNALIGTYSHEPESSGPSRKRTVFNEDGDKEICDFFKVRRHYSGGLLARLEDQVLLRDPKDCRKPATNSLGISSEFIPPLENEVLFEPVPQESAYIQYLNEARTTAANASALIIEATEAQTHMHVSEARYQLAVETALVEAAQGMTEVCGARASAFAGDPDRAVAECSPELSSMAPEFGYPDDDVRARWLTRFLSTGVGPLELKTNETIHESLVAVVDRCDTAPDHDASASVEQQVDALAERLPCASLAALVSAIDRMRPGGDESFEIPKVLEDGTLSDAEIIWEGEVRQILGDIETQLDIVESVFAIAGEQTVSVYEILQKLKAEKGIMDAQQGSSIFQSVVSGLEAVGLGVVCVAAIAAIPATGGMSGSGGGQACMSVGSKVNESVGNATGASVAEQQARALIFDLTAAAASYAEEMERGRLDIEIALDRIRANVWKLRDFQSTVRFLAERADREERVAAAEAMSRDPWVRASVESHSRRALEKFERAKKLAFIARRAIEFRFVVDFERMHEPMILGDAPANWHRDVFLDGFTYDEPVDRFMKPTIDYVEKLSDFVNFYSASYPFQSASTTAVISMKDDFGLPYFTCCGEPDDPRSYDDDGFYMCTGERIESEHDVYFDRRPCTTEIVEIQGTGELQELQVAAYDNDGTLLRSRFERYCEGDSEGALRRYPTLCDNTATGYYSRTFRILLSDFNQNRRLAHLGLSDENYNYRIRNIAVNLVGSNALDCSQAIDPNACYAAAFIPFDLVQTGVVNMADHGGRIHEFNLPRGGVRGGKALVAERFITSPIANTDLELLSQYWAEEFRGRPLQGSYELRLYQTEGFRWSELEDIQIVVQLDYWSPFENLP